MTSEVLDDFSLNAQPCSLWEGTVPPGPLTALAWRCGSGGRANLKMVKTVTCLRKTHAFLIHKWHGNGKDIYDSLSVLLPHIVWIQHTILRVKYINSTHSPSQTLLNYSSTE